MMDGIGVWGAVMALTGALGGLEFVKWVFNRRHESRSSEFRLIREEVTFFQEQLREKENRFAEQTDLVRKLNLDILELIRAKGAVELELVRKRCDDLPCPFREPPTAMTQPQPGMTRDEYFESVTKNDNRDEDTD